MARSWIRLYVDVPNDPKVQLLPDRVFRFWVNCLCVAGRHPDGLLPPASELAFALRLDERDVERYTHSLVGNGLLEPFGGGTRPHNWGKFQYEQSTSTQRMRRLREKRDKSDASHVTSHVTKVTDTRSVSVVSVSENQEEKQKPITREGSSGLWIRAGFDSPEGFEGWFTILYAEHPTRGDFAVAKSIIFDEILAGKLTRSDFETGYAAYRRCDAWTRDNGRYIPKLSRFCTDRSWKFPPKNSAPPSIMKQPDPPSPMAIFEAEKQAAIKRGVEY